MAPPFLTASNQVMNVSRGHGHRMEKPNGGSDEDYNALMLCRV